jgi:hypothetical protein
VRTRERQYGIRLRYVAGPGTVDAPEDLRMIVRVLERRCPREKIRASSKNEEGRTHPTPDASLRTATWRES